MTEELAAEARFWWQDDQERLASEQAAMYAVAPKLIWRLEGSGDWAGRVPLWPIPRPRPAGVAALVRHREFAVTIKCGQAYPMVEPMVFPEELEVPIYALGINRWHLLPNGALCLLQEKTSWDPSTLAAELIPKISGWYIEYHLEKAGYIDRMTDYGIANDDSFDRVLNQIEEREDRTQEGEDE